MTWKLYKYDGHYIKGTLISKHTSQSAALKRAKKEIKHETIIEQQTDREHLIWLDDKGGMPLGVIIKQAKAAPKKIS